MTVSLASPPRVDVLAGILDRVYARYNHRRFIGADPLQFAYRFDRPQDAEVACFLAAALAYGRVQQIQRSLNDLFARMDCRPYDFVTSFSPSRRSRLAGFKHRFTTAEDLGDLLELLRPVLRRHGSIESFFVEDFDPKERNVLPALARFCDCLTDAYARRHAGRVSRGLMYLLASPSRGSASKRLHLFLRWMVRADDVDPGLWKGVKAAKLIVPLDVHMARLCRILGLHDSNTISQSTAVQVTEGFGAIAPADPVKYDFALSRIGILDECTGRPRPDCQTCELFEVCLQQRDRSSGGRPS
jgi:uncharacterized protein (TIGR02757 family)